jgi:hypothetical protein
VKEITDKPVEHFEAGRGDMAGAPAVPSVPEAPVAVGADEPDTGGVPGEGEEA